MASPLPLSGQRRSDYWIRMIEDAGKGPSRADRFAWEMHMLPIVLFDFSRELFAMSVAVMAALVLVFFAMMDDVSSFKDNEQVNLLLKVGFYVFVVAVSIAVAFIVSYLLVLTNFASSGLRFTMGRLRTLMLLGTFVASSVMFYYQYELRKELSKDYPSQTEIDKHRAEITTAVIWLACIFFGYLTMQGFSTAFMTSSAIVRDPFQVTTLSGISRQSFHSDY